MKKFVLKYKIYLGILVALLIILILLGVIFGKRSHEQSAISIDYLTNDQKISISNALPMTDVVGKNISVDNYKENVTGYTEFKVEPKVKDKVRYEIYLTKEDRELEVPIKFVKVFLTDSQDQPLEYFDESRVPTYYDLRLASSTANGKLIYSGLLKAGESKTFKLRMWVADTYELTAEEVSFSTKINVVVK